MPPAAQGYSILKVAQMLASDHIRNLPSDVRKSSILVALDAAGVDIKDVIQDAVRRDRALDTYEPVQQRAVEGLESRKSKENSEIQAEIDKYVTEQRAKIQANNDEIAREKERFTAWRLKKQEEKKIAEAVGYFVTENPITTGDVTAVPSPSKATQRSWRLCLVARDQQFRFVSDRWVRFRVEWHTKRDLASEILLSVEDLDPAVSPIRDIHMIVRANSDAMRRHKLTQTAAALAQGLDPVSVRIELRQSRINVAVADIALAAESQATSVTCRNISSIGSRNCFGCFSFPIDSCEAFCLRPKIMATRSSAANLITESEPLSATQTLSSRRPLNCVSERPRVQLADLPNKAAVCFKLRQRGRACTSSKQKTGCIETCQEI